jgi:hypothetical protein
LVTINGGEAIHYRRRADLVCELATQLRDTDPNGVWDYLTATPASELQRLLMIALAGIDVDKPVTDVFGWVLDLPTARLAS